MRRMMDGVLKESPSLSKRKQLSVSKVAVLNQTEQSSSSAHIGSDRSDSDTGLWRYLVKVVRKSLSRLS